jgi:uncharacterized protein
LTWLPTGLRPRLDPAGYVFVTAPVVPPGLEPFAAIREDEGVTLVVSATQAAAAGLAGGWLAARITLQIDSALSDVGLTAYVSARLADAGISCNVIAAVHHDHLFVPYDQGSEALRLLAASP